MLNKNNRDSLSITDNQATVNPAPSTVTLKACPWCCQPAGDGLSPAYTGQARYGPCSHCGGLEEVLDGIRWVENGLGGYIEIYVQGIEFGTTDEDRIYSMVEAAKIYNNETLSLAVAIERRTEIPFDGSVIGVELREYEEIEGPF